MKSGGNVFLNASSIAEHPIDEIVERNFENIFLVNGLASSTVLQFGWAVRRTSGVPAWMFLWRNQW